jgi:hypothetical protein
MEFASYCVLGLNLFGLTECRRWVLKGDCSSIFIVLEDTFL